MSMSTVVPNLLTNAILVKLKVTDLTWMYTTWKSPVTLHASPRMDPRVLLSLSPTATLEPTSAALTEYAKTMASSLTLEPWTETLSLSTSNNLGMGLAPWMP